MAQMKPGAKLAVFALAAAVVFFGAKFALNQGWIPAVGILKSVSVAKAQLPSAEDAQVADVQPQQYPSVIPTGCQDPLRSEIWAWNAMIGWLYSNGGIETTKGSLGEKHAVCLKFDRQDDTGQMKADLLACAKDLKSSNDCSGGVNFITIMADGSGQFLGQYNAEAKKICPDCTAEIVGTTGFSRGEDALWGPSGWKKSPRSALGDGLIAGVLRDGDWDTGMKWAGDNSLKNNPDEHTFDESALNWVNAKDYIDAAQKYVAGYCEDRKVIKDGHLTGEVRNVCVKGVVTWTPGDTIIAHNKGGIVRIVSTKEYRSQMPSAIIGIKKWDRSHSDRIAGMLAAALEGGDQVKAFPEALKRAGDISAKIYCQNDACAGTEQTNGSYWVKYYKGSAEPDAQGKMVDLGGSYADNMNDALTVFGMAANSNNNLKSTYTIFARIVDQQYHEMFTKTPIPPYEQAATTAYLIQAKSLLDSNGSAADTQQYDSNTAHSQVVSDKNWDIEFATGSSMLTARGMQTVAEIKDELAITGLTVTLNGFTDNTGNRATNIALSEQRAEAVKYALQRVAKADFPDERFRLSGHGPDNPVCTEQTPACLARNRRVEVILAE